MTPFKLFLFNTDVTSCCSVYLAEQFCPQQLHALLCSVTVSSINSGSIKTRDNMQYIFVHILC